MPNFLHRVAHEVLHRHSSLKHIGLILPSRRAGLFLKKELAAQLEKPQWAPKITTIEDFVLQSQGLKQEEPSVLIFELYEAYQRSSLADKEPFADFNKWAHLLLADFNEIDRYLVEPGQLFSYLADVKRIERWNLKPGEKTEMLQNYLRFWESLSELYTLYTKALLRNKKVYQGLAYRTIISELPAAIREIKCAYEKLYFVGFNALNTAEEKLLLALYEEGVAEFFWDVDAYYFEDDLHEAGKFLRKSPLVKHLRARNDFHWLSRQLIETPKKIRIIAAPGNHMQARAANAVLSGIPPQEHQDTAVVLADEQLLVPFLSNLNQEIEHLNITMGLPLHSSPLASFFQLLWDMMIQEEQRREKEHGSRFYHALWDKLLASAHLKKLLAEPEALDVTRDRIRQYKQVYLSLKELKKLELPKAIFVLLEPVLGHAHTAASGMYALQNLCLKLKEHLDAEQQFLHSLYSFYKLFGEMYLLFEAYPFIQDFKTAQQFYRQLLHSESLDLYGEPLRGLQLMGMLETRTLQFKRVILTSLNEDILPAGRSQNSLIPFDIKREFGLPTYLEKDSVYAYHFYRLLQGAEEAVLIYNKQTDGLGGGEASRFIAQLEFELKKVNANAEISRETMLTEVALNTHKTHVEKSPKVIERLQEMAASGFSPTALSTYITDPLRFYYERVLGIPEATDLEDIIGFDTQGNVVHTLLEELYRQPGHTGEYCTLNAALLEAYLQKGFLEDKVREKLLEHGITEMNSGKNLLIREMLTGMLQNFFRAELHALDSTAPALLALEQKLEVVLPVNTAYPVRLKGTVDRVDRSLGIARILDYKTGFVDSQKLSVSDLEQLKEAAYGKAFQLCMYAYLFLKNKPEEEVVHTGIISLRNAKEWVLPLKYNRKAEIDRNFIPEFEAFLHTLMQELFDPALPFREGAGFS